MNIQKKDLKRLLGIYSFLDENRFRILSNKPSHITVKSNEYIIKILKKEQFEKMMDYTKIFGRFVKIPRMIGKGEFNNNCFFIYERIPEPFLNTLKKEIPTKTFIKKSAELLAKIHLQKNANAPEDSLFDLLKREIGRPSKKSQYLGLFEKIYRLLDKNKKIFSSEPPCFIHGDFHQENIIWNKQLYLIDFECSRYFDYYYDLCSVYLYMLRGNKKKFGIFLNEYSKFNKIKFSKIRFLINLMIFNIKHLEGRKREGRGLNLRIHKMEKLVKSLGNLIFS